MVRVRKFSSVAKATIVGIGATIFAAAIAVCGRGFEDANENAYKTMRSFSCGQDPAYELFYFTWRNDTERNRHPGAFEGGGDKFLLLFRPVPADILSSVENADVSVSIDAAGSLLATVGGRALPVSRLSANLWVDGEEVIRPPHPVELRYLKKDVERYLSACAKTNIAEIEINNGLH